MNIFIGLIANAAMGIATQVNTAITSFINSFQTSFRPQIVKAYANGEKEYLKNLVCLTSKYSFLLIYIPAIFLIVNMPFILKIWLNDIPTYSIIFCRLIIICCIIDAISGPYNCAIIATGQIKYYQILLSISASIEVILYYIVLANHMNPASVLIVRIFTRGILNMVIGLYFTKKQISLSIKLYMKKVLLPISLLIIISMIGLYPLLNYFSDVNLLIYSAIYSFVICTLIAVFVSLTSNERQKFKKIILHR